MERNNKIKKIITYAVLFGMFVCFFIIARLGAYSIWLFLSYGPIDGTDYTQKIVIQPETKMSIGYKKTLNIYYIDNYPVLCVKNKNKRENSCIKLDEMKNIKLYNIKKTRILFGTTILATVEPYPEINLFKDFFRRRIFSIDYNIDGAFSSYFYPKS